MSDNHLPDTPALLCRDKLELLLRSLTDGIMVIDKTGIIRFRNDAAQTMLADRTLPLDLADLAKQDAADDPLEVLFEANGSEPRTLEIYLSPISWQDEEAVLLSMRDISERKERETERRQAESLANVQFLAGAVAHEFSQPLQVLNHLYELLESEGVPAGRLAKCREMSDRIAALVRQMRNIIILQKQPYLNDFILDLAASARAKIGAEQLMSRFKQKEQRLNTTAAGDSLVPNEERVESFRIAERV